MSKKKTDQPPPFDPTDAEFTDGDVTTVGEIFPPPMEDDTLGTAQASTISPTRSENLDELQGTSLASMPTNAKAAIVDTGAPSTQLAVIDTVPYDNGGDQEVIDQPIDHSYEKLTTGGKAFYEFWASIALGSLPPREFDRLSGKEQDAWVSLYGHANGS
jgi:hypothetical protein